MRITNQVLFLQALGSTQDTLSQIEKQQRVISSGLRVEKPSDDPAALGEVMRSSSGLRSLEQYRTNLATARARLSVEDGVLEQTTASLIRAKELAISQAGSTANAETRSATRKEVEGIRDFLLELGNTRFSGSYLFGGDYADTPPLTGAGTDPSRPPVGTLEVEGGAGSFYAVNHGAQEIFVDSGALDALSELALALGNDDQTAIQTSIGSLDTAFDTVQELTGELGARMNQVDTALSNLDALEVNLRTFRSELQDADLEEAISQLVSRQITYQAAMLANARILNTTLTDYLR